MEESSKNEIESSINELYKNNPDYAFVIEYWNKKLLETFFQIGLNKILDSPKSLSEISEIIQGDLGYIVRFLRTMESLNYIKFNGQGKYFLVNQIKSNKPIKEKEVSIDMIPWKKHTEREWYQKSWENLERSIKEGKPAFNLIFDKSIFEYLDQNKKEQEIFQLAMSSNSERQVKNIISKHNFSKYKSIIDIGGGHGDLIKKIKEKFPKIKGGVFDRKAVIEEDKNKGLNKISGDFFEEKSIPEGFDLYALKFVIHDWNDIESMKIFKNCSNAMNENSKLIIVERVLPESPQKGHIGFLTDISMMVLSGGKERTLKEYITLAEQSGLSFSYSTKVDNELTLLEFKKS